MSVTQAEPALTEKRGWQRPLPRICFAVFAFEIGVFLAIFPWMDSWHASYFEIVSPAVQQLWNDAYFRGALSGLGLVDIYIAFAELIRLVRGA